MAADDARPTLQSLRRQPARPAAQAPLFDLNPPAPPVLPAPPAPRQEARLYTVRGLIAELRSHVELGYPGMLHVEGEISNYRPAASGHVYFTLKDGDAQLPIVLFRRQALLLRFRPKDGDAIEVKGRIAVYETRGQLQLIAETLKPRGEGALLLAFEELKRKLAALFARDKTPLPLFPHCLGIVTSPTGAALRDIIHVVRRRHARLNILIYPAVMQGTQCAPTVAAGIRWFNQHPEHVDLILIARGGGSLEDLAGFNDEALARTIAASRLPVVSAIGHETDHTIADFVADLRAPTPSAAAELITAAQHQIDERVASLERRVLRAAEFHRMRARQRLQKLSADQVLARLAEAIGRRQQRLDELRFRMEYAAARFERTKSAGLASLETRLRRHDPTLRVSYALRRLALAKARLAAVAGPLSLTRRTRLERATLRLQALSPLAVLNRGYAIVYDERGAILRDASDAASGSEITARLAAGAIRARVV